MPFERIFAGWDKPMLPWVARWLSQQITTPRDYASWTVVTPGGASQRRLMELLVNQSGGALTPPQMLTPGALPEHFYKLDTVLTQHRIAESIEVELAWALALLRAGKTAVQVLTPDPPDATEFSARLGLARRLVSVSQDLAGWGVSWQQAQAAATAHGDQPQRWDLLEALETEVDHILEEQGLIRRDAARVRALEQENLMFAGHLVLVGTIDLNAQTRSMLNAIAVTSTVYVLVHAPESQAAGFVEDGTLFTEYWSDQAISISNSDLRIADQPVDQADAVVTALGSLADGENVATCDVVVSLADPTLLGPVRRAIEMTQDHDHKPFVTRYAAGRSLAMSRPVVLLRMLASLASDARLDRLGWLVRHPDFSESVDGPATLDRYIAEHLIHRWTPGGSPIEQARHRESVTSIYQAAAKLLPIEMMSGVLQDVGIGLDAIESALLQVYGDQVMSRFDDLDRITIDGLAAISRAMDSLRRISQQGRDASSCLLPELGFSQVLSLVAELAQAGASPERGDESAIEIAGFLETALDDHRFVIAVGLNEGSLPTSVVSDPFLPDSVRRALNMMDNRRRLARDVLLTHSLIEGHERVIWIAGRRGESGDPLKPSRLMLRCSYDVMLERLKRFYDTEVQDISCDTMVVESSTSKQVKPEITRPVVDTVALETLCQRLPVTALSVYVKCPYRFYLTYLRKLRRYDDEAYEMDALAFGSLVHEVLQGFGLGLAAASQDSDEIAHDLATRLDGQIQRKYASQDTVALRVQREQAMRRLERFADWQAEQVAQGWRIDPGLVEREATLSLVPGVKLIGKFDRVDRHESGGQWRVMDYKTGDSPADPKDHTRGHQHDWTWIKFQLPIYRAMLQAMDCDGSITTGYVALSKKDDLDLLKESKWDETAYQAAIQRAGEVATLIRRGVFWPPSHDLLDDDFSAVTLEGVWGRSQALSGEDVR